MAPDDGMGETDPWRQFRRGDRDIAVARAFSSRARGVDRGHLDPLAGSAASFGAWVVNRSYAVAARFGLDLPGEAGHGAPDTAKRRRGGLSEPEWAQGAEWARAEDPALGGSVESAEGAGALTVRSGGRRVGGPRAA